VAERPFIFPIFQLRWIQTLCNRNVLPGEKAQMKAGAVSRMTAFLLVLPLAALTSTTAAA
jgi:hypothetical protein